jgi:hypothetical protein
MYAFYNRKALGYTMFDFFSSPGDAASSSQACLYAILAICLPIYVFVVIRTEYNKKTLQTRTIREKYSIILTGNRTSSLKRALYFFFFLTRRLLSAVVLVVLEAYPFFQFVILFTMSLLELAYLTGHRPIADPTEMNILILNEACVYLCTLCMGNLINIAYPDSIIELFCWLLVGLSSASILGNLV